MTKMNVVLWAIAIAWVSAGFGYAIAASGSASFDPDWKLESGEVVQCHPGYGLSFEMQYPCIQK